MRAATCLVTALALCVSAWLAPRAVGQVFSNPAPIVVPSSGSSGLSTPYPSTITVAGLSRPVSRVAVSLLGVSHSFPDDLAVLLVAPDGRPYILMAAAGGGSNAAGVNLTFATDATVALPNNSSLTSGTFLPSAYVTENLGPPSPQGPYTSTLSPLVGIVPNGTWSLYVFDRFSVLDGGSIAGGWSIAFTTPLNTVDNPTAFTYQGRLTGAGGTPVNGPANLRFSLWTSPSTAALADRIAGPTAPIPVTVSDGVFTTTVDLGPAIRYPTALWLLVEVESPPGAGFVGLTPLQPLSTTPVATRALTVDVAQRADLATLADRATSAATADLAAAATNLEPQANQYLRGFGLFLRSFPDASSGLFYVGPAGFGSSGPLDGPVLVGLLGGALGTVNGGARTVLTWTSAGQVGIGTSAPADPLHVVGNVRADGVRFPDSSLQTTAFPGRLKSSIPANLGLLAPAAVSTVILNVPGAAVGDVVYVSPRDTLPNSLLIGQARVTSANNILFTIYNSSSLFVDPPNTTFDVVVLK